MTPMDLVLWAMTHGRDYEARLDDDLRAGWTGVTCLLFKRKLAFSDRESVA